MNNYTVNFTSTANTYCNEKSQIIRQTTSFAREDLNWKKFIKILDSNFKDKSHVNIHSLACSDGSEPISTLIFLDKHSENAEKYFPIFASDLHKESIDKLNTTREIVTIPDDFDKLSIDYRNNKYLDYVNSYTQKCIFDLYFVEKMSSYTQDRIKFSSGNLLDKLDEINDDSNTVIMCRNVLPYFYDEEKVVEFAQKCNEKLNDKSLVVIGEFDKVKTNIDKYLKDNNFVEIDRYVYQKREKKDDVFDYFYPAFLINKIFNKNESV